MITVFVENLYFTRYCSNAGKGGGTDSDCVTAIFLQSVPVKINNFQNRAIFYDDMDKSLVA